MKESNNTKVGVVSGVNFSGRHGPYAYANVENLGTVTFSLEKEVWQHSDNVPESGTLVVLDQFREKEKGWRAMSARYKTLDD